MRIPQPDGESAFVDHHVCAADADVVGDPKIREAVARSILRVMLLIPMKPSIWDAVEVKHTLSTQFAELLSRYWKSHFTFTELPAGSEDGQAGYNE